MTRLVTDVAHGVIKLTPAQRLSTLAFSIGLAGIWFLAICGILLMRSSWAVVPPLAVHPQSAAGFTPKDARVDPSTIPLEQLARFRGALFTARAPLSQGPRPGAPTNVVSTERGWDWWTEADWQAAEAAWRARGLTHVPIGPLVGDDCYHGVYRPCNQSLDEGTRDRFLDFVQRLWDDGFVPVYRHKPDNWETPDHAADLDRLDALMSTARAQRLLRVVTYPGWEPNGGSGPDAVARKYGWTNATYVRMLARGARVFPNALRTLHTTCDTEVPIGGNTEDPALTTAAGFAQAWKNILPYFHVWEHQVCGYLDGGSEMPMPEFLAQLKWVLQNQPQRTRPGGVWYGGVTAWGPGRGLVWVLSEYGSYRHFWDDWNEAGAQQIGDFAMCYGADGYFDGGTVSVPISDEERARVCRGSTSTP